MNSFIHVDTGIHFTDTVISRPERVLLRMFVLESPHINTSAKQTSTNIQPSRRHS